MAFGEGFVDDPSTLPAPMGAREHQPASTDVLVIGSGGAGLQAALAAARAGARVLLATKLGLASSNTAKAQGGIQAALGEDDDPAIARRRRHARARTTPPTRALVEVLTGEAPDADRAARALRRRVHAHAPTAATGWPAAAARRASGCCRSATAPGHAIATALRAAVAADDAIETLDHAPLRELEAGRNGWRATLEPKDAGGELERRRRRRRAGRRRPLLRARRSGSARSRRTPPAPPAR